jgi:probable HAF family extracellular repeat protein
MRYSVLCVLALQMLPGLCSAASFLPLGFLPGRYHTSGANAVSSDGSVVVGHGSSSSSINEAFRWTSATGMVGLGSLNPEAPWSNAFATSSDGSIIVGTSYVPGERNLFGVFRWSSETGFVGLVLPAGSDEAWGVGVSGDGSLTLGNTFGPSSYSRFKGSVLWTSGGGQIPVGDATSSGHLFASGISADGNVVIGSTISPTNRSEAAYWTNTGGISGLGDPLSDTYSSGAYAVSADGAVIVGSIHPTGDENFDEAFRWTRNTGMVGLGRLPGATGSKALGVSGDGSIVVGLSFSEALYDSEAMIWSESAGLKRLLDVLVAQGATGLDGWTLNYAAGISEDGRWVVGDGENPNGDREAFLANIAAVPAPAALWLLGTGCLGLVGVMRRKLTS